MTTTIVLLMFVVGVLILFIGKPKVATVPDQSVFKAGMISAIALFGIAWLTATFISAHEEYIISTIGEWVTSWPFIFALAVFLVAALTTSQSTATRTIVPIGLAAGLPAGVVTGMWAGALGGVYTLPANGTQIAAANFDLTGTTKLGTKLLDHSFFVPDARALGDHHRGRRRHRRHLLLTRAPARPVPICTSPRGRHTMQIHEITEKASALMPGVLADLEELVAIPSVSFPGYPSEPMDAMAQRTLADVPGGRLRRRPADGGALRLPADLRRDRRAGGLAGGRALRALRRAAGAARSRAGRPTRSPRPARTTAASTAAGAADDMSGLVAHLGTLRVFDGKPPCTVKLILEGMEETESNLEAFVEAHPELFDVRPVRHLRHGQPAGRRAGAHDRPARRRGVRGHGAHPGPPAALRRVRRAGARRDDGARPAAVDAARRRGQRRRRGRLDAACGTART